MAKLGEGTSRGREPEREEQEQPSRMHLVHTDDTDTHTDTHHQDSLSPTNLNASIHSGSTSHPPPLISSANLQSSPSAIYNSSTDISNLLNSNIPTKDTPIFTANSAPPSLQPSPNSSSAILDQNPPPKPSHPARDLTKDILPTIHSRPATISSHLDDDSSIAAPNAVHEHYDDQSVKHSEVPSKRSTIPDYNRPSSPPTAVAGQPLASPGHHQQQEQRVLRIDDRIESRSAASSSQGERPERRKMRIGIRWQFAILIVLASLIGLAVVTIATWITNHNFVLDVSKQSLTTTASLKAAQIASSLLLFESGTRSVGTRVLIQNLLAGLRNGDPISASNTTGALSDLLVSLDGGDQRGFLLQSRFFAASAPLSSMNNTILQATSTGVHGVVLPYANPDGSVATLGGPGLWGYPPNLYPNFTYTGQSIAGSNSTQVIYRNQTLDQDSILVLGPYMVNTTFAVLSMTIPVLNNTASPEILGWMSMVIDAKFLLQSLNSPEGLGGTGATLMFGPANRTNRFPPGYLWDSPPPLDPIPGNVTVKFVFPPNTTLGRHTQYTFGNGWNTTWLAYPAIKQAFTQRTGLVNNAGAVISTRNENQNQVSVGYATINSPLVDWLLMVEIDRSEIWHPIDHLRTILITCVFCTAAAIIILSLPLAHFSTRPIRRLGEATKQFVEPPGHFSDSDHASEPMHDMDEDGVRGMDEAEARKEGFFAALIPRKKAVKNPSSRRRKRAFRIPSKVQDHKHLIKDELSDLTRTFNEMCDELMVSYEKLEERVRQRTAELEESKKAAEAANEMKTLFVANISHELKTPLNGIIGVATTAQAESNITNLKRDMRTIYSQGDLLQKLIEDLLSFSKNQIAHTLVLEEKEFRTRDISTQVYAVFDRMAADRKIKLAVEFEGPHDSNSIETSVPDGGKLYGPFGTGRVKDMVLWGDKTRILQVVINLTSNALKFTREGGGVTVVVRCVGDAELIRKESFGSKQASGRNSRTRVYSQASEHSMDAMSSRNNSITRSSTRSGSPPPNARELLFEFEVQDSGVGIPSHLQDRIFEPFFQGDMQLTKKYSGTGLGLSICRQLATLMHGSIDLISEEGKGSTFTMRIPLKHVASRAGSTASSSSDVGRTSPRGSFDEPGSVQKASKGGGDDAPPRLVGLSAPFFAANVPAPSAESAELGGRKLRILIAEDNKTNQMVVLRMLRMEKIYNVDVAEDGVQAVSLVKSATDSNTHYDLIFMDVQMPNMDGLEATRLIREGGFKRPIVALSAYSDVVNVQSCLASGMDDFVSKPIQIARLRLVLKTFCPHEEPSPAAASAVATANSNAGGMGSSSSASGASAPSSTSNRPGSSAKDRPADRGGGQRGSVSSLRKDVLKPDEERGRGILPGDEDVSPKSSSPGYGMLGESGGPSP